MSYDLFFHNQIPGSGGFKVVTWQSEAKEAAAGIVSGTQAERILPRKPPIGMVYMHIQQFQWEGKSIHQTFPRKLLHLFTLQGPCISAMDPRVFSNFVLAGDAYALVDRTRLHECLPKIPSKSKN